MFRRFSRCLLLFLFASLTIGCRRSGETVENVVEEMLGKQVVLALGKMDCVRSLVCSGGQHPSERDYKVVVYIDSANRTPCDIDRLYEWNAIMKEMEEYADFIFIVSAKPEQIEDSYLSIASCGLLDVVYLDTAQVFWANNRFLPEDDKYHTFLINKDNEIAVLGSPLRNQRIKELMKRCISENLDCR